ncbi:zf-TFIIB domain-containing protein [bacterium]|nr:zf-TFIIB domain-containing protein [bacterium]
MIKNPSQEEEYIARQEFEKLQKIKAEKQLKLAEEEKTRLRELHYMRCPKCGMELIEIGYRGVMIDECSGCEGIWLDAGELEAISKFKKTNLDKLFSIFKKD